MSQRRHIPEWFGRRAFGIAGTVGLALGAFTLKSVQASREENAAFREKFEAQDRLDTQREQRLTQTLDVLDKRLAVAEEKLGEGKRYSKEQANADWARQTSRDASQDALIAKMVDLASANQNQQATLVAELRALNGSMQEVKQDIRSLEGR